MGLLIMSAGFLSGILSGFLYYNWKWVFFNCIRLYNNFFNKPIVILDYPTVIKIVTKRYTITEGFCSADLFADKFTDPITVFFTLKGNTYAFITSFDLIKKTGSYFPYKDNNVVDNKITIAMLNGTDITNVLRMYAGPKGNFYSDLEIKITGNDLFPNETGKIELMVDTDVFELELTETISDSIKALESTEAVEGIETVEESVEGMELESTENNEAP
jgi:hypothetical protein